MAEYDKLDMMKVLYVSAENQLTEAQSKIERLQKEVERTNDGMESQAHVISDLRMKLDSAIKR